MSVPGSVYSHGQLQECRWCSEIVCTRANHMEYHSNLIEVPFTSTTNDASHSYKAGRICNNTPPEFESC
jgi:hypothetical protein